MKKYFLIISVIISSSLNAQEHFLGGNVGYISLPNLEFLSGGLRYELFNPSKGYDDLSFWFEGNYGKKTDPSISLNKPWFLEHFKTELGFDAKAGRKLHFLFGGGLYLAVLSKKSNYFEEKKVNNLNWGLRANSGAGYDLSNHLKLKSVVILNKGMSPVYYKSSPCHFGNNCGQDPVGDFNLYVQISLLFKLNKHDR